MLEEVTRNTRKNVEERKESPRAWMVDGIVDFDAKEFFNIFFSLSTKKRAKKIKFTLNRLTEKFFPLLLCV